MDFNGSAPLTSENRRQSMVKNSIDCRLNLKDSILHPSTTFDNCDNSLAIFVVIYVVYLLTIIIVVVIIFYCVTGACATCV